MTKSELSGDKYWIQIRLSSDKRLKEHEVEEITFRYSQSLEGVSDMENSVDNSVHSPYEALYTSYLPR